MPLPRLSIVLPTYNRVADLRRAIAALLRQSAGPGAYEVVVVDNNSDDDTAALLAATHDDRVRSIREPRQGLSFARNTGIAAARADIIAFTDDDVEAAPDWVETVLDTLDAHPDVDGAGGRVLPAWSGQPPRWLTRRHWAPLALQDHGDSKRVFDRSAPIGLVGANVAFRREVFDRIGTFDSSVQRVRNGIGSTEDHELLTRLYDAGGKMLYVPKMLVIAHVQPDRCSRTYHRRWHTGHGRFHALMRLPDVEQSRATIFGVPAHMFRSAAADAWQYVSCLVRGDHDGAFVAELRLRFFVGFFRKRVA